MFMKKSIYKINYKILIPIILLSIISIISIYSASIYTSSDLGNLALKQGIWYIIGWILVYIIYKLGNDYIYDKTWILYVIGNILLFLLLIFGTEINGSKCWFVIPGIGSIQPSEFMKIFIMLQLASMIHKFRLKYRKPTLTNEFIFILKTLLIVLIPSVLTFIEPDTGSVIIYFVIYISMLFISGIRFRWFLIGGGILLILIGGILLLYFNYEDTFVSIFGNSMFYRLQRVFNWNDGGGMQYTNSIVSIGTAGLLGHGIKGTPMYFPEASTDFIFSIYASSFGLLGVIILLGIIIYLDVQIIILARKRKKDTDKYILAGILGMLLIQQVQNIGMTIGLFPITGITLPFVSYGGSSLLSYMLLVGMLINISNERNKKYSYN